MGEPRLLPVKTPDYDCEERRCAQVGARAEARKNRPGNDPGSDRGASDDHEAYRRESVRRAHPPYLEGVQAPEVLKLRAAGKYAVECEIAGVAAIWTRPDSGGTFVSYPAPTYSALKAICECVVRLNSAYLRPIEARICAPIRWAQYKTNYGGAGRNPSQIAKGSSYQLPATILVDVCYQIVAVPTAVAPSPTRTNHLHALQEMFYRRLDSGKLLRTPCLGWSEFTTSYFGRPRSETRVCEAIDLHIPTMLYSVWDRAIDGKFAPEYRRNVAIANGIIRYD